MNAVVKDVGVYITLMSILGSIVYNFAIMSAEISENKANIAERKLTGKTVRRNTNRIIKLETTTKHYQNMTVEQGKDIEHLRTRTRNLESKK